MTNTVKISPTKAQVALVVSAITAWPNADFVALMDDDGLMILSMTEDGLTMTALFDYEGHIIGDWH